MSAEPARPTVAVIGSGVSGLTAAYRLSEGAEVTLFEAEDRIGGHADTSTVLTGGGEVNVDTGFIVHNDRTYPVLLQMFDELGVRTRPTGMSMSVRADSAHGGQGLEYAGARGPAGLFGDRRNLLRPAYLRMLWEIPRFHRTARQLLASSPQDEDYDETLGEFLRRGRFSDYFIRHFATPLIATVWSCDPAKADEYPLRYLLTFLHHHGMLRISGSPHWRTVVGGSREYVRRIVDTVTARGGHILTGTAVSSIRDTTDGVLIGDGDKMSDDNVQGLPEYDTASSEGITQVAKDAGIDSGATDVLLPEEWSAVIIDACADGDVVCAPDSLSLRMLD
ncbi:MAG: FAD-dependent oxidoreductase, partial [Corynebacterium variabile]|nr:FAD-dependent oxidoreductase [Corynebacterium variabile]